jgi:hypothetical protein
MVWQSCCGVPSASANYFSVLKIEDMNSALLGGIRGPVGVRGGVMGNIEGLTGGRNGVKKDSAIAASGRDSS